MKLSTSLLLPALVGAASAVTDHASVYIFQGEKWPKTSTPAPEILSPEQARLVIAQRLGVSQYHSLKDASRETLKYINSFGRNQDSLFSDELVREKPAELVIVVEGVSSETAEPLLSRWESIMPAFLISNPPSSGANKKLVRDLHLQQFRKLGSGGPVCSFEDHINPLDERCWNDKAKLIHIDLSTKGAVGIEAFMLAEETLSLMAKKELLNLLVVLVPKSRQDAKDSSKPYGSYEMPSVLGHARRQATEEPITYELPASSFSKPSDSRAVNASTFAPVRGIIPLCHSSFDSCVSVTNNCSGHGTCIQKYNSSSGNGESGSGCYSCGCVPTIEMVGKNSESIKTTYWGGGACNKKDVSGPFWLFAVFTVIIIGIVSWAIGMLFSIGEEKLPGVIGAGVSSKAR